MKKAWVPLIIVSAVAAVVLMTIGGLRYYMHHAEYDFYQTVPGSEALDRVRFVRAAEGWLGCNETDGTHKQIIDIYNSHEPLAQGYEVKYTDEWCATFVSAIAISYGITDIIPTECGCQRQIALFQSMGVWVENDDYKPYPGDIIYYCREDSGQGDCTGWSDHVGIVVGTAGPFMKVIEGNYNDAVAYRYLPLDSSGIRGFAVPDFRSHSE